MEVFDLLPITAVIDGKYFCVHAGISPSITTIDQINLIDRRTEIPTIGPLADLTWSDPGDEAVRSGKHYWIYKNPRGAGCVYYEDAVKEVKLFLLITFSLTT
jgi:serine/threonine-protein phosphatase 4 catalytic subunit